MPVLRCDSCGTVVAWLGKALAVECPGEHPDRTDAPLLHVDEARAAVNGDGIDVHLSGLARRERAAVSYEERMERWAGETA